MKPIQHFVCAVLLISAFAISTPAGEQDTPGYVAPPPPTRSMTTTDDDNSNTNTDQNGGITTETSDYLLYDALAVILSVYWEVQTQTTHP